MIKNFIKWWVDLVLSIIGMIIMIIIISFNFFHFFKPKNDKPRLLWGAQPIKSLTYTAEALRDLGYISHTVVVDMYNIVNDKDFNICLLSRLTNFKTIRYVVTQLNCFTFFARSLFHYDIYHYFFDGGILQRTKFKYLEFCLLKLFGKKIILFPYGSDAFIYEDLANLNWRHALLSNYPLHASRGKQISRMIQRGCQTADVICGCLVHITNLPRWDILPLTWYAINTHVLTPLYPPIDQKVTRITHSPNHRGVKGSEFLLNAIARLQAEGYNIEFTLIEKVTNKEALDILKTTDIHVDQLVFGYALNAMEAMALGKVVISGIEPNDPAYQVFSRYSYLNECPVVPASPETIYDILKKLIHDRRELHNIGKKSRIFMEKRNSYIAIGEMFELIYKKIWHGQEVDLINYFHPLFAKKIP